MTQHTAAKILTGQGVLAVIAIAAVMLLAYWRLVDGTTAVTAILAITGVTSGTGALIQSNIQSPSRSVSPTNQRE